MSGPIDEAKGTAQDVVRKTQDTLSSTSKRVAAAAATARDRASDMIDEAHLDSARASIARQTRKNPFVALLIAGLVGIVFSRLLSRKRR